MEKTSFLDRFRYAVAGLAAAWRAEASFRTEVILALVWFVVLAVVGAAPLWWILSSIVAGMVLAAELVNTALEHLADHVEPEQEPAIAVVKDCAAAAVLVSVAAALVVAGFTLRATVLQP